MFHIFRRPAVISGLMGAAALAAPSLTSTALAAPPLTLSNADGTLAATFSLQYRPRFETNDGKDFTDGPTNEFLSHRARLGLKLTYKTHVEGFVQVQDVRRWGEETDTLGDANADTFDLHQGFVKLAWENGVTLHIGRQEIAFDEERLVGAVNWAQQGRSFDAVRFTYSWGTSAFHAAWAKLAETDTATAPARDRDLGLLRFETKATDELKLSVNGIYDAVAQEGGVHRYTVGPYLQWQKDGWKVVGEAYYQGGEATKETDFAAYLVALRGFYTFDAKAKPTVGLWAEFLSGDDDPSDDTVGVFDTLFATNHAYYGAADIFTNIPVDTRQLGLIDVGGRVAFVPGGKVTVTLDGHQFLTAEDTAGGESDWGTEADLTIKTGWWEYVSLTGGLSGFFPGKAMEELRGDESEIFSFLMLDVAF